MPHLLQVGPKRAPSAEEAERFPFSVPAIRTLPTLDVEVPVTIFVGENGSGKSTLLEAIAIAAELTALGEREIAYDETLSDQRRLAATLRLAWRPRSRQGFFLRAEDFFGYARYRARAWARYFREMAELEGAEREEHPNAPGGLHPDEIGAAKFIKRYDGQSHGESFLDLFSRDLRPGGLYLLDEPEAPLSPTRQLALLGLVLRAADEGSQFIIATHSPILLACPNARIFSFDSTPIAQVTFADLEHVNITRDFLNHPEVYLRRLRSQPKR